MRRDFLWFSEKSAFTNHICESPIRKCRSGLLWFVVSKCKDSKTAKNDILSPSTKCKNFENVKNQYFWPETVIFDRDASGMRRDVTSNVGDASR